jgi:hypothetical protein
MAFDFSFLKKAGERALQGALEGGLSGLLGTTDRPVLRCADRKAHMNLSPRKERKVQLPALPPDDEDERPPFLLRHLTRAGYALQGITDGVYDLARAVRYQGRPVSAVCVRNGRIYAADDPVVTPAFEDNKGTHGITWDVTKAPITEPRYYTRHELSPNLVINFASLVKQKPNWIPIPRRTALHQETLDFLERCVQSHPEMFIHLNGAAWVHATSPEGTVQGTSYAPGLLLNLMLNRKRCIVTGTAQLATDERGNLTGATDRDGWPLVDLTAVGQLAEKAVLAKKYKLPMYALTDQQVAGVSPVASIADLVELTRSISPYSPQRQQ